MGLGFLHGWLICFFVASLSSSTTAAPAPSPVTVLPSEEVDALWQLRSSLTFTPVQLDSLGWTQSIPCLGDCGINECYWGAIACSGGHVIQIDLSPKIVTFLPLLMSGSLVPALNKLGFMTSLRMNGHTFLGELPSEWGNMTALEVLDLSSNTLTGNLPPSWSGMTSMVNMNLSNNAFNGAVPVSWTRLPRLQSLDVRSNSLCLGNATFSSSTDFLSTTTRYCTSSEILASQAPIAAPSAGGIPAATPSPTASSNQNYQPAPILQMSTGINIAVSVVIGAFLLFGIIAGIIRVKRQQRAHQRWITGRMVELRQREAQEEANFQALLQKIVPPSIILDPQGDTVWIAHPDKPVSETDLKQAGEEQEYEGTGAESSVTPAESLPDSSVSNSAAANESTAQHASTAVNVGGSEEQADVTSVASSPSRGTTEPWPAINSSQLPPLREQYRYITEFHRRQRMGLKLKKVPLFTVDVFISDKGSLTYHPSDTPPLDIFRPNMVVTEPPMQSNINSGNPHDPAQSSRLPSHDSTRDEKQQGGQSRVASAQSFRAERSPNSTLSPADLSEVEARRAEGIGRLREETPSDSRRGDAPPAPLVGWPGLRRFLRMESLQARDARLRTEADSQFARDQVETGSQSQPMPGPPSETRPPSFGRT